MSLDQYLSKSSILLGLEAETSSDVICQLGETLFNAGLVKDSYVEAVINRDKNITNWFTFRWRN